MAGLVNNKVEYYNNVWVSPKEVAFDLSVSYRTVLSLIKEGRLIAYKVGRHYKIDPKDIQKYIENNKVLKPF